MIFVLWWFYLCYTQYKVVFGCWLPRLMGRTWQSIFVSSMTAHSWQLRPGAIWGAQFTWKATTCGMSSSNWLKQQQQYNICLELFSVPGFIGSTGLSYACTIRESIFSDLYKYFITANTLSCWNVINLMNRCALKVQHWSHLVS